MTSNEVFDLLRLYPETPLWILQNRDSISLAEAKAMMKARRKCLEPLKRAS